MHQLSIRRDSKVLVVKRRSLTTGVPICFWGERAKVPEMLAKLLGRYWHLEPVREVIAFERRIQ